MLPEPGEKEGTRMDENRVDENRIDESRVDETGTDENKKHEENGFAVEPEADLAPLIQARAYGPMRRAPLSC